MKLRLISASSLSLSCCLLVLPHFAFAQTQASAAPTSDDSTPLITVQIAPPPVSISSAMLGLSGPLGAQSTVGKPVFAEFVTEHHQSFSDGNRISRSTTSSLYRDALGRIRRESQLSLPGMSAGVSASTFITIVDQKLGYGFVLDPREMVAHRYELNASGPSYVARVNAKGNGSSLLSPEANQATANDVNALSASSAAGTSHWRLHGFTTHHKAAAANSAPAAANAQLPAGFLASQSGGSAPAPAMRLDQPFLAAPNPVRTENLGEQMILGFKARGTRVITTLPAGQIGNEHPIDIVSEQWFSPELELVMRSMHRDPFAGEFITTIKRISRGDQPAPLFQVPAPYKVIDAAQEGEHHVLDGHSNHGPGSQPW